MGHWQSQSWNASVLLTIYITYSAFSYDKHSLHIIFTLNSPRICAYNEPNGNICFGRGIVGMKFIHTVTEPWHVMHRSVTTTHHKPLAWKSSAENLSASTMLQTTTVADMPHRWTTRIPQGECQAFVYEERFATFRSVIQILSINSILELNEFRSESCKNTGKNYW